MATGELDGRAKLVFAYYVTGHGFGHATRVVEVRVPSIFFAFSLQCGMQCGMQASFCNNSSYVGREAFV